jgi:hypothetical protein
MTWVIIAGLVCLVVGLLCRCEGQEDYIETLTDERDQALAGYDCLAEKFEDLLEAQPDYAYAGDVVEEDELEDALIEDREVEMLQQWFDLPAVEME